MNITVILIVTLNFFDFFPNRALAQEARITRLSEAQLNNKETNLKRRDGHGEVLKKIIENNKKLNSLLQNRSGIPVIWEKGGAIKTGKIFRGTLLNSVVSSNLATPVIIWAHEGQGLLPKTKFICQGVTQHKRVFTLCNKMVNQEKEIAISAQVLNLDGSSGLVGDYDDGKEELIAGAVISDFSQGMLSVAQSRVASPFGAMRDDTIKNQLLQGAIESGRTTSDVLLEEMKTKEPIVTVDSGIDVLVYFMEAIHEN
jgi:hypothetical protein